MQPYRSPVFLSRLAIGGLGVIAVSRVLLLVTGIGLIIGPARADIDLGNGDSLSIWALISGLIALLLLAGFFFTVVTFLMWLHRTFANFPSLRAEQTEFTPGWAVGWWFIPFANLVKPYQAVRTVWAESDPEVEVHSEFLSAIQSGAPGFIMLWWGAWIISNIFSNLSSSLDEFAKPGEETVLGYAMIIESCLWLIASGLAIKVVLSITGRQEKRHARVGDIVDTPPPPPTFET